MTAQKWNLTISLCNLSSSKVRASFNFVFITLSLNPIFILVLTKVKLHGSIISFGSKNNVNHILFFLVQNHIQFQLGVMDLGLILVMD